MLISQITRNINVETSNACSGVHHTFFIAYEARNASLQDETFSVVGKYQMTIDEMKVIAEIAKSQLIRKEEENKERGF